MPLNRLRLLRLLSPPPFMQCQAELELSLDDAGDRQRCESQELRQRDPADLRCLLEARLLGVESSTDPSKSESTSADETAWDSAESASDQ